MPDNIYVSQGAGTLIATKEVANLHYQSIVMPAKSAVSNAAGLSTTAYSVNDAVGTGQLAFDLSLEANALLYVMTASLYCEVAVAGGYRLMLFNDTVAAQTDNSAFTMTDADAQKFLGWIDFPSTKAQNLTNNVVQIPSDSFAPLLVPTVGTIVYGQLIATEAFTLTGVSGNGISIRLSAELR